MIVAIIQARMGSTRLPGKCVLRLPSGKTVIEQVIERAKAIPGVGAVIVAIPERDDDSELDRIASRCADDVISGPEHDVMARYWTAACGSMYNGCPPTTIIRITADDPFRDPEIESYVGKAAQSVDYAHTIGLPVGINAEAFSIDALAWAVKHAQEREHLTTYFKKWADARQEVRSLQDYSHLRCTLDTPADWEVIQAIDRAGCKTTEEIVRFWEARHAENR